VVLGHEDHVLRARGDDQVDERLRVPGVDSSLGRFAEALVGKIRAVRRGVMRGCVAIRKFHRVPVPLGVRAVLLDLLRVVPDQLGQRAVLGRERGHGADRPVDEDAELRVVEPGRQLVCVEALEIGREGDQFDHAPSMM
jgi:hypothetical protein